MNTYWLFAGMVCTVISLGPAQAEDRVPHDWQGVYGGLAIGGVFGASSPDTTVSDGSYFNTPNIPVLNRTFQKDILGNALSGAALLGYNFQDGNLVWGLEADLSVTNFSASKNSPGVTYNVPSSLTFNVRTRIENLVSLALRPRIGYSFGETLVHFGAGPAVGHFNYRFDFSDGFAAQGTYRGDKTALGLSTSIGATHQIGGGWSLRGDYVFSYYPDIVDGSNRLSNPGGATDVFTHDADFQSHNLRVGLVKRF
jgi:outer membrane immunogenic protein